MLYYYIIKMLLIGSFLIRLDGEGIFELLCSAMPAAALQLPAHTGARRKPLEYCLRIL